MEARIEVHGADSIQNEGDYPTWFAPYPMVQVGPARTWADVVPNNARQSMVNLAEALEQSRRLYAHDRSVIAS